MAARPPSIHLTGTRRSGGSGRRQTAVRVRFSAASCQLLLLTGQGEPATLIGRRKERKNFWDALFCNRPRSALPSPPYGERVRVKGAEERRRRSGDGSGIEPAKMFGAVRGSLSHTPAASAAVRPLMGGVAEAKSAETPHAAVRTVKLSTSYFFGGDFLAPSALRPLDLRGHKEVRRRPHRRLTPKFE